MYGFNSELVLEVTDRCVLCFKAYGAVPCIAERSPGHTVALEQINFRVDFCGTDVALRNKVVHTARTQLRCRTHVLYQQLGACLVFAVHHQAGKQHSAAYGHHCREHDALAAKDRFHHDLA